MKKWVMSSIAVLALGLSASAMAQHWHGHGHFYGPRVGVVIGGPGWYGPGWYGPGWGYPYYSPPVVTVPVPTAPPVYVEAPQAQSQESAPQPGYWYYCANPAGYYPDVQACPGGWQQVAPRQ